MKPIKLKENDSSDFRGCVYLLGFPGTRLIYIGSTKRGAVRLREHGLWLSGHRHPNKSLQEAYDTHPDNLVRHVILNVWGYSNSHLRNFEWGLSIRLTSSFTILNDDTTANLKYHLEEETTREVLDLIESIMEPHETNY